MAHQVIPIEIAIVVEDIDDVLVDFDQIQVWRSTTVEGGPYAEITTPEARIDLQNGIINYTFEDIEGSEAYFYKFRFYNSTTTATSAFSDPQPGKPDPALDIISVEEVKTLYLFGLDLTNDAGVPYPDSLYAHYIKSAVSWLELRLDLPIKRTIIEEERHDFYREDYNKFIFFETDLYPIISVEEVKMVLPGEQVVQVFDKHWIHMQRDSGQIQLVPGTGSAGTILLGAAGNWLPFIYGQNRFVPDVFRIKYTAGFGKPPAGSINAPVGSNPASISVPDAMLDKHAAVVKDLVGKIAAFGPLNIAGDLLGGAGIASQSLSIDGLSQSVNTTSSATNAGYGARLLQYRQEIKDQVPTLHRYYKGIRLRVG